MADFIREDVACPHCKGKSPYTFYMYVDDHSHPELLERCRKGTMFDFVCPHCGKTSRIGYPMVYHDIKHRMMIFVASERDPMAAIAVLTTVREAHGLEHVPGYQARAVQGPLQLMEKLAILDHDLDDRTVEMCKAVVRPHIEKEYGDSKIIGMFLLKLDGELVLTANTPTGLLPVTIPLTDELYDGVDECHSAFYPSDPMKNIFVDDIWTQEYLEPDDNLQ